MWHRHRDGHWVETWKSEAELVIALGDCARDAGWDTTIEATPRTGSGVRADLVCDRDGLRVLVEAKLTIGGGGSLAAALAQAAGYSELLDPQPDACIVVAGRYGQRAGGPVRRTGSALHGPRFAALTVAELRALLCHPHDWTPPDSTGLQTGGVHSAPRLDSTGLHWPLYGASGGDQSTADSDTQIRRPQPADWTPPIEGTT